MTDYKSDLLATLSARGYIHQMTDAAGLDALAVKQVVPARVLVERLARELGAARARLALA